jgi:hypothetical protein
MTGTFHSERGELVSHGVYGGKMLLQRGLWSNITANAHDFEVDVSQNGGLTWKPVFVAALTRIGPGL